MERINISDHIFLIQEELKNRLDQFKIQQLANKTSQADRDQFLSEFEKIEEVVQMLNNWFIRSLTNL